MGTSRKGSGEDGNETPAVLDGAASDAVRRRARELADKAPPLEPGQIVHLRAVFASRSGGRAR